MTHEERYEKIVVQYNEWMKKYCEAIEQDNWGLASYHAFMLNAVLIAAMRSNEPALKEYFNQYADTGR